MLFIQILINLIIIINYSNMDSKNAKNGLYGCLSGVIVAAALQPL